MNFTRFYVLVIAFLLCVSVFAFTRTPGIKNQNSNVTVTNLTNAFQVTAAQRFDNQLRLSLRNIDHRSVTAFVITIGKTYRITEEFVTSGLTDDIGVKSQQTFERTYPIASSERNSNDITLQTIVFDDKTGEGNPVIFEEIRATRLAHALQIKRSMKLLQRTLDFLSDQDVDVAQLKNDIETELNRPETETLTELRKLWPLDTINRNNERSLSDFVQQGLAAGKTDVLRRVSELDQCANRKDKLLSITTYYQKLLARL